MDVASSYEDVSVGYSIIEEEIIEEVEDESIVEDILEEDELIIEEVISEEYYEEVIISEEEVTEDSDFEEDEVSSYLSLDEEVGIVEKSDRESGELEEQRRESDNSVDANSDYTQEESDNEVGEGSEHSSGKELDSPVADSSSSSDGEPPFSEISWSIDDAQKTIDEIFSNDASGDFSVDGSVVHGDQKPKCNPASDEDCLFDEVSVTAEPPRATSSPTRRSNPLEIHREPAVPTSPRHSILKSASKQSQIKSVFNKDSVARNSAGTISFADSVTVMSGGDDQSHVENEANEHSDRSTNSISKSHVHPSTANEGESKTSFRKNMSRQNDGIDGNMARLRTETGVQVGVPMILGALVRLFRRRQGWNQDDTVAEPAEFTDIGSPNGQLAHGATRNPTSSRAYVPCDPVSQQVMRQAAIHAARSAAVQASEAATKVSGTGEPDDAGVGAVAKLFLLGILVGALIAVAMIVGTFLAVRGSGGDEYRNATSGIGNGEIHPESGSVVGGGEHLGPCNIFRLGNDSKHCEETTPSKAPIAGALDDVPMISPAGTAEVPVLAPALRPGSTKSPGSTSGNDRTDTDASGSDDTVSQEDPTCPERQTLVGTMCVSSADECEEWQIEIDGECRECPAGQIVVQDSSSEVFSCMPCGDGLVRGDEYGMGPGYCVSGTRFCRAWQYAVEGKCNICPTGEVSTLGNNGLPNHLGCEYCPPGEVRATADGDGLGPCVDAEDFCDHWQSAVTGYCSDCPHGYVSAQNPITLRRTHESCQPCEDGFVRASADGAAMGECIAAEGFCEPWQFAKEGKCTNCPPGQVGINDFRTCDYCPDGQIRGNRSGTGGSPCIDVIFQCTEWEIASLGVCEACPDGQHSSVDSVTLLPDFMKCEYCPVGEVRSSRDGFELGPCVSGEGFCNPWEKAQFGACTECPEGKAAVAGDSGLPHEDCQFCPLGQVRATADGRGEGPCVKAYGRCDVNQRAIRGVCVNCLDGKLSSRGEFGLYDHYTCV